MALYSISSQPPGFVSLKIAGTTLRKITYHLKTKQKRRLLVLEALPKGLYLTGPLKDHSVRQGNALLLQAQKC